MASGHVIEVNARASKGQVVKKLNEKQRNGIKVKGLVITFLFSFTFSVVVCPCVSADSMWSRTYGGTGYDAGTGETVQTSTGGYAISGDTNSSGAGGLDFWLFETDADGNMQWNKTYSTLVADVGLHAIQTADGGYAIVGWNFANGQDLTLYKTDVAGNLEWNMTYGGTGVENGFALLQTGDGGYVLTGNTDSFGAGGTDIWLVKTDEEGIVSEGLTVGVMLMLSTVATIVGIRCLRKRPQLERF